MIKWLHHLMNPHCPHCAEERRESRICNSCNVLEIENNRLVRDNERLLELLLTKPQPITDKQIDVSNLKPIQTSKTPFIPTAVRRQTLERESRHSAAIAAAAPKPDINKDTELKELEDELNDVRKAREEKIS